MGSLKKRSVNLAGHATSLALEPEFWTALDRAAQAEAMSLAALIQQIDTGRGERPLASACRVFALRRAGADQPGRGEVGNGDG
ncbi:ribbon-helix-helix domain-containing protein [Caulobacter sp. DWR1-3-2b1]|uniref:ribbon-helix-helix domain-containing protein n=1 Tax=Caulobacter sp. DWR1-3-2b1 TaxID=2804670 RepID=UPI003CF134AE